MTGSTITAKPWPGRSGWQRCCQRPGPARRPEPIGPNWIPAPESSVSDRSKISSCATSRDFDRVRPPDRRTLSVTGQTYDRTISASDPHPGKTKNMTQRFNSNPGLSRRSVLRAAGVGGLAMAAGGLLAACSDNPSSAESKQPSGAPVKGGTMRIGLPSGGASSRFTPYGSVGGPYSDWVASSLFEPLRSPDLNSVYHDVLIDELTAENKGAVWVARLKQGVEFHNGKTLTADDVIHTYKGILDPANGAFSYADFSVLDSMQKLDDRTIRFNLKRPSGRWPEIVATRATTGIVPVDFDEKNPVGTGPYKFVSRNGNEASFERFDNYHGDVGLIDGYRLIPLPDDDARVNALLSGAIDFLFTLPPTQVARLQADSRFGVLDLECGVFDIVFFRTDKGPFKDNRIRRAIRMAVDREEVLSVVYGGRGQLGNDLYGLYDKGYAKDLVRTRDVDGAKALIKEAGAEGLTAVINTHGGLRNEGHAMIVAKACREIGLNITVETMDQAAYGAGYPGWPAGTDSGPGWPIMSVSGIFDAPGALLNATGFVDDEYTKAWQQAEAALTDEARAEPLHRMQEILFDRGGFVISAFGHSLHAYAKGTTGWPNRNPSGLDIYVGMNKVAFTGQH